jgi:hypothetical protein
MRGTLLATYRILHTTMRYAIGPDHSVSAR